MPRQIEGHESEEGRLRKSRHFTFPEGRSESKRASVRLGFCTFSCLRNGVNSERGRGGGQLLYKGLRCDHIWMFILCQSVLSTL